MKFVAVLASCLFAVVSAHCKTCYSVGDPHFQTFNGQQFDFHQPGWQTLFQKGAYVVQAFHKEYNGNGVAVNTQVRYYTPVSQGWLGGISGVNTWPGNSVTLTTGTELLVIKAIPLTWTRGYDVYVRTNMEDNCCGLCCNNDRNPPSDPKTSGGVKFPTGKNVKVTKAQAQKACARLTRQRKNCITDLQMVNDPKIIAKIVQTFKDVEATVKTLATHLSTSTDLKRTWREIGSQIECDTNAGEVYLKNSPGKVSSLEQCKKSCQHATACESITYFNSGWCSHFSTSCTKTKRNKKAIALRLSADTTAASTAKPQVTPGTTRTWREIGSNSECDTNAGEVYLKNSPGKVSSLEQCKKSCQDASGCESITYFKSGWCSHFSTPCTNTKRNNKAVAFRLSADTTAASTAKPQTTIDLKRTWREIGSKSECDTNAGEVYLKNSPGKVSSLEQCKKSCQHASGCESITYFKSGWCSHFSTPCTKTKRNKKAIALRLSAESTTTPGSSSAPTSNSSQRWVQVITKAVCDTKAGEVYMTNSPGKVSSAEECKKLCQSDAACKSITIFQNGWCSHFSTPCAKTSNNNRAVASWRLVSITKRLRGI